MSKGEESMKEGWKMVKLGEVCETSSGGTPSKLHKEYYENGNIPWMLSGEVCRKYIYNVENYITEEGLNNSSAKLFPLNTVVVAMYGATAGQVGILKVETSTNQAVCGILPNKIVLPEFLYYYFLFCKDSLVAQAVGNAQPNISQQKIKAVEIPLLSFEEQHRIVSILDAAFAKIDALKANAEANLKNAKALFQQVLAEELKPKVGWVEKKLGEMGALKNGMNFANNESGVELHLLGVGDFGNLFVFNNTSKLPTISLNKMPADDYLLQNEDIVFVRSNGNKNLVGRSLIVYPENTPTTFSGFCIRFRKTTDELDIVFLIYYLKMKETRKKLLGNGANISNLNQRMLQDLVVSYPPISTQHQIVQTLDALSEKCRRLEQIAQRTIDECDALKQSILRRAFSGEL